MTLLHDYLHTRNQQGFVRLLDSSSSSSSSNGGGGNGVSGSAGRSWGRGISGLTIDINARDWLGRTALHLACTTLENIEFVRALLKHPNVNVNLADTESHWTALHRALYHANFPAALLLLQRNDTDTTLKDLEGYTAFDLYNSTVDHSKPDPIPIPIRNTSNNLKVRGELFTWGANRNAALGLGDGDDRGHPEQVILQPQPQDSSITSIERFMPVYVSQVHMSKLHTALVTEERTGNVRVCGFGSGGRLGPTQHTLYTPTPLPTLASTKITALALGQDHTLALTSAGEVLSWGLNRFGQLGYTIESVGGFKDTQMQLTPKRVYGPLKKEVVRGVAAAKTASACWTGEVVYTWGTNGGQLGYDKSTNPLQPLPRIVSLITKPVLSLSLTSTVLACLLITHQVECIFADRHIRVNFPAHIFPSEIQPYRPPMATREGEIRKIVCGGGDGGGEVLAALSESGEVFIFGAPSSSSEQGGQGGEKEKGGQGGQGGEKKSGFKPQRVWALRKKFSAVRDVAVGNDGSIIVCTESGHVFTRSRSASGKQGHGQGQGLGKFHRVSGLQRVVSVCANSTGAFGALRVDFKPEEVKLVGRRVGEDLKGVEPYRALYKKPKDDVRMQVSLPEEAPELDLGMGMEEEGEEEDKDEYDLGILRDVEGVKELCAVLKWEKEMRKLAGGSVVLDEGEAGAGLPHGADALVVVGKHVVIPVHRVVLASRCPALYGVLSATQVEVRDPKSAVSIRLMSMKLPIGKSLPRIAVSGCHPLTVLILLRYLYSDELLAVWDSRVCGVVRRELGEVNVGASQVKIELQALSRALGLQRLTAALEPPTKRTPTPSLEKDLTTLFQSSQSFTPNPSSLRDPLSPDVILQLADRDVYTHSTILRSRSEFFGGFFDEAEWTCKRRDAFGVVKVDMRHLEWHVMRFVLGFLCCGEDEGMFDCLEFTQSVDDVLEFMFDVMAAANELLLDRLVLLCSSVILKFTNLYNACSILAEATYFNADQLIDRIQSYMTVNMEAFLDTRMLNSNSIPHALAKQLSLFVKAKQLEKSPVSRSGRLGEAAVEKHAGWLALQDIPQPVVTRARASLRRETSTKLSPPGPARRASRSGFSGVTPPESPRVPLQAVRRPPVGDDIFEMDDADEVPQQQQQQVQASPAVWKPASRPRVDMKTVMADQAASGQKSQRETPFGTPNASSSNLAIPHTVARKSSWNDVPRTPPAATHVRTGPWKTPAEAAARHSPPGTPGTSVPAPVVMATPPRPRPASNLSATKPPAPTTPQQLPGLGPVITPTRQPSSKPSTSATPRHVSGGKAWTLPPVQPVIATSPPTAGMSFVAIQHSQLEQVIDPAKDKRSLREIQEEEQARQAEEDFMKWWHEEEERVRLETEALAQFQAAAASGSGAGTGRGKGGERGRPKGKPGRGRGGKKADRDNRDKDKQPQENAPLHSDGRKDKQQYHAEGSGKPPGGSRDGANANANTGPRHRPRRPAKDKAAV